MRDVSRGLLRVRERVRRVVERNAHIEHFALAARGYDVCDIDWAQTI
jgi:hypothetical protein